MCIYIYIYYVLGQELAGAAQPGVAGAAKDLDAREQV